MCHAQITNLFNSLSYLRFEIKLYTIYKQIGVKKIITMSVKLLPDLKRISLKLIAIKNYISYIIETTCAYFK